MTSVWFQNDLNDQLLYENQKKKQLKVRQLENQTGQLHKKIICSLCSKFKKKDQMYEISSIFDQCGHYFCLECLQLRVVCCIARNEDVTCPIDFCPCKLDQKGKFYKHLSENIKLQYQKWKKSEIYKKRNTLAKMSFRQSQIQVEQNDATLQRDNKLNNSENIVSISLKKPDDLLKEQQNRPIIQRRQIILEQHRRDQNQQASISCIILAVAFVAPLIFIVCLLNIILTALIELMFIFSISTFLIEMSLMIFCLIEGYQNTAFIMNLAGLLVSLILAYVLIKYRKQIRKNTINYAWNKWKELIKYFCKIIKTDK